MHLTEIGHMIHQINQNLKENLNLKWEIGEFPFLAQKSKKEIQCGKIHLAKMGHAIYHSDRNFEENPDLKSVFANVLCGICYSCFSAGGGVISTLPKQDILYIIWTAILKRIQI